MSEEKSVAERLRDAQAKVKQFTSIRDQVMRDVGSEERKLEEAYEKLRELGVDHPESLSAEQLQKMITDLQVSLEDKLAKIENQLTEGDTLISRYQALQGQA